MDNFGLCKKCNFLTNSQIIAILIDEEVRMEIEILEGPNGAKTITAFDIFRILWKIILIPNDLHPEERCVFALPLTVKIEEGEQRDLGELAHAGFKLRADLRRL